MDHAIKLDEVRATHVYSAPVKPKLGDQGFRIADPPELILGIIRPESVLPENPLQQPGNTARPKIERTRDRNVVDVAGVDKPRGPCDLRDAMVDRFQELVSEQRACHQSQSEMEVMRAQPREQPRDVGPTSVHGLEESIDTGRVDARIEVRNITAKHVVRRGVALRVHHDVTSANAAETVF
jgi:hypothetical protein